MATDRLVAVIGLDGATWRVLDELDLPAIDGLAESGTAGTNKTCLPHFTTPAWQCYARGLDPSGVGVYDFMQTEVRDGEVRASLADSTDFSGAPIWAYLDDEGLESAVLNLHNTRPVSEINGVMVGEHAEPDPESVYPESYIDVLDDIAYWEPENLGELTGSRYFDTLMNIIDSRFLLAEKVLDDPDYDFDFFHLSIFYIDAIMHEWWGSERVETAWEFIDKRLGDLLPRLRDYTDEVTIVLMSDHGHVGLRDRFSLNDWLVDEGYLVPQSGGLVDNLDKYGLNRDRLEYWADRMNLLGAARRVIPTEVRRRIPDEEGFRPGAFELAGQVDVDASSAFYAGGDCLYVLDESVKDEIRGKLGSLGHPENYDEVFYAVRDSEYLYAHSDRHAPDLVLHPTPGYRISQAITGDGYWEGDTGPWGSVHDRFGIFATDGPEVPNTGCDIDLYDVMPTVLARLDCRVPKVLDGDVVPFLARDVEYRDPLDDEVLVRDYMGAMAKEAVEVDIDDADETTLGRLKDLGYLE